MPLPLWHTGRRMSKPTPRGRRSAQRRFPDTILVRELRRLQEEHGFTDLVMAETLGLNSRTAWANAKHGLSSLGPVALGRVLTRVDGIEDAVCDYLMVIAQQADPPGEEA